MSGIFLSEILNMCPVLGGVLHHCHARDPTLVHESPLHHQVLRPGHSDQTVVPGQGHGTDHRASAADPDPGVYQLWTREQVQ